MKTVCVEGYLAGLSVRRVERKVGVRGDTSWVFCGQAQREFSRKPVRVCAATLRL